MGEMAEDKRPPLESFFKSPIQQEDLEHEEKIKFLRGKKGEKGEKGEKGDKGDKGDRGPRGFDGTDGKEGKQGERGPKGDRGERGFVGEEGRPGKDGKDGIDGKDGKNAVAETAKSIVDKINKGKSKIEKSKISGLEELENKAESNKRQLQNYISLGGNRQTRIASGGTIISTAAETINFTGATVSVPSGNNGSTVTVAITGNGFAGSQEKSTTTPNGSQQTFAFTHTPIVIFWNGAFQTLTDDYTVSGNNITFTGSQTPQTGDKIVNLYA